MFEDDKTDIIKAAKCISVVLVEETQPDRRSKRNYFGTAFFVSENLLLTAGHIIAGVNGPIVQIRITQPGLDQVQPWQVSQRKVPTIVCKVVGTIYKRNGPLSTDITILDSGSFRNSTYLPLALAVPQVQSNIDVIGYPGYIKHEWIEAHEGVTDFDKGQKEAERLLPKGHLTVTRGTLEALGPVLSYNVSTCPGMSGSCVLYKGAVVGNIYCVRNDD
jgi:V8-like Glu-specific endopeptidase